MKPRLEAEAKSDLGVEVRDEAQSSAQAEVHYVQILGAHHIVVVPHLAVPPMSTIVLSMIVKSVMYLLLASKMMDKSGKEAEKKLNLEEIGSLMSHLRVKVRLSRRSKVVNRSLK
ncbi:hypothetical protein H5410_026800 [Solanum commersonii]|uniref:Uncharacterized protein n=1 Tax=Solanum commersonii TaxID=4109 RepID=A0A9J5Z1N9_SOLCO|nr:hypothetical protein H5410_026800 [Solanum commersonii]